MLVRTFVKTILSFGVDQLTIFLVLTNRNVKNWKLSIDYKVCSPPRKIISAMVPKSAPYNT